MNTRQAEYTRRYRRKHAEEFKANSKIYYQANKDQIKKYRDSEERRNVYFLKHYGLTVSRREELLRNQDYCCACCGKPLDMQNIKDINVDHAHDGTINYRAILCHFCNVGIGYFDDSPDALRAAAIYLETHPPLSNLD